MSVTVATYKNFVGGEWVDAVDGGIEQVVNPATGEIDRRGPEGHRSGRRSRGPGGQERLRGMARDDSR